jgi:hypothetical protein
MHQEQKDLLTLLVFLRVLPEVFVAVCLKQLRTHYSDLRSSDTDSEIHNESEMPGINNEHPNEISYDIARGEPWSGTGHGSFHSFNPVKYS